MLAVYADVDVYEMAFSPPTTLILALLLFNMALSVIAER